MYKVTSVKQWLYFVRSFALVDLIVQYIAIVRDKTAAMYWHMQKYAQQLTEVWKKTPETVISTRSGAITVTKGGNRILLQTVNQGRQPLFDQFLVTIKVIKEYSLK